MISIQEVTFNYCIFNLIKWIFLAKPHKTGKQGIYCYNSELAGTTELNLKSLPFKATKVITRHQSFRFSDKLLCAKGIKRTFKKAWRGFSSHGNRCAQHHSFAYQNHNKAGGKCLIRYIQSFYLVMILIDSVISSN